MPLNWWVTINWATAGAGDRALKATGRFFKLANDWLRSKGYALAYVWVRETGPYKGEHVHIAMHVPPHVGRAFGHRQRAWIKRAGETGPYRRRTVKTDAIGLRLDHALKGRMYGEFHADDLARVVAYMLKGADDDAAALFGIVKREFGGEIIGKRCGTCLILGRAAQRKTLSRVPITPCHDAGPQRVTPPPMYHIEGHQRDHSKYPASTAAVSKARQDQTVRRKLPARA